MRKGGLAMGCLMAFIFLMIAGVWYSLGAGKFILYFLVFPIGGYMIINSIYQKYNEEKANEIKERLRDPNTPEAEKEQIREQIRQQRRLEMEEQTNKEEMERAISTSGNLTYIGGHERYTEKMSGEIYLYDNEIRFYKGYSRELVFSVPIRNIGNSRYETSQQISADKAILFGVMSLGMKDNIYFLTIDYLSSNGIENEMMFELGKDKRQSFINELNAVRNRAGSRINSRATNINSRENSSVESIKQLAELRDKGILTEEEFTDKKTQILNRM